MENSDFLPLVEISETFSDYPDFVSLAVIAFFEGCSHNCKGCQSPELQKVKEENKKSLEECFEKITDRCKRNDTNKIVLSGGDPYDSGKPILKLISKLQESGYEVCVYTGYDLLEVLSFYNEKDLRFPSYLKCGVYREDQLNDTFGKSNDKFVLVSKNQAFYKWSDKEKSYILLRDDLKECR